jgi:hypothetical protein
VGEDEEVGHGFRVAEGLNPAGLHLLPILFERRMLAAFEQNPAEVDQPFAIQV